MGRSPIGIVERFAEEWHGSCWRVDDLPARLNATLIEQSGPAWVLGVSCDVGDGRRLIALNEWLQREPRLRRVVLAHEAAHLIANNLSQLSWCDLRQTTPRGESVAWMGAGLLLMPRQVALTVKTDQDLERVADDYDLPYAVANLSVTVHQVRAATNEVRWDGSISDAILGVSQAIHMATRDEAHRAQIAMT